ncbi:MAG: class I SAM-dependent methyltransferase [Actinomycetota bacterium]|nr:class I SAM-dependent methyltransferase [Actinomycetota bacterium]
MSGDGLLSGAYELQDSDEALVHYEAWAATYDDEIDGKHQYAQPGRCASALLDALNPEGVQVLDVGCGTGLSGLALAAAGFEIVDGCDLSPAMLEQAARTGTYRRLFEANLNEGIDVPDGSYDAAAAVGVLSFGHIRADAMREMLRVVKPGGLLVVGLNDHFWVEGAVAAELDAIEADGQARVVTREHGDHLPGAGIDGWVVTMMNVEIRG